MLQPAARGNLPACLPAYLLQVSLGEAWGSAHLVSAP